MRGENREEIQENISGRIEMAGDLAQDKAYWRALQNAILNLRVP